MRSTLAALLPAGIAVVETLATAPIDSMSVAEAVGVAAAVPKRVLEFATGRWCARAALAQLGTCGFSLLAGANRAPIWPPGIVGSITHTDGFCAAAVGRREQFAGIGIDAELIGQVGAELWPQLFIPAEIDWLERLPEWQRPIMATLLFSAKESFYKCQHAFTSAWLDFKSACVTVEDDRWHVQLMRPQSTHEHLQQPICGRFALSEQYVFTAINIPASHVPLGNHC